MNDSSRVDMVYSVTDLNKIEIYFPLLIESFIDSVFQSSRIEWKYNSFKPIGCFEIFDRFDDIDMFNHVEHLKFRFCTQMKLFSDYFNNLIFR